MADEAVDAQRVWAWPQGWEYLVELMSIADRWSAKAQANEIASMTTRMNARGAEGWELVGYEAVPLYGAFSQKLKGYAYLTFWKRPRTE